MTAREHLEWLVEKGGMLPANVVLTVLEEAANDGGPEYLSTVQAAKRIGYSPKWWARQCAAGNIEGAWQDDGYWRIPKTSAHALILRRQHQKTRTRRGPRKAQAAQAAQAARARAEDLPAEGSTVVPLRPPPVERRPASRAKSERPRLA